MSASFPAAPAGGDDPEGGVRTRTVAAGAAFAGDRIEPAVALGESGIVDDVALECLAERTIVAGLTKRRENPELGHDVRLERRLTPLLPAAAARGCRIVSNLGSANPASGARAAARLAASLGLGRLRVAGIVGDDVLDRAGRVAWASEPQGEWLGAHAYLGYEPLRDALDAGADVVLTGRVADAALFMAPVAATLDDAPDSLAGAVVVGHLLECAGQVTGGNYEAPGGTALDAAGFADLGYPIACVASDGSAELSILEGTGGILDALTCTLQLLYEVHDPTAYITPDAIVDLSGVRFEETGPRRVRVTGARYVGRPEQLKVSGFAEVPGAIADVEIAYAGDGALGRARIAADVLRLRLERLGVAGTVDLVGVDAVLGSASRPLAAAPPELRVHVSAACDDAELAQAVEDEVYALTVSGPAGGAGIRSERRFPRVEVIDGLIDRDLVTPAVVWGHPA